MARCGCASDRCDCYIVAGDNVAVTGSGSRSNPYVVTAVAATVVDPGAGDPQDPNAGRFPGEIVPYGGTSAPAGWVMCDGTPYSRTIYGNLFAAIGTKFGAGDNSTTFNVPNLVGRFPVGASDATRPLGSIGGTSTVTLSLNELPVHRHDISHTHTINHDHPAVSTTPNGLHDHAINMSNDGGGNVSNVPQGQPTTQGSWAAPIISDGTHSHTVDIPNYSGNSGGASTNYSSYTGSGQAFNIMNPFLAVNYIIKT